MKKAYIIGIILLVTIACETLFSQAIQDSSVVRDLPMSDNRPQYYRFSFGLGLSSLDVGLVTSCTYDMGNQFITLRYSKSSEFLLIDNTYSPMKNTWDIGAIYGLSIPFKFLYTSFGAGIGYIHDVTRGKFLHFGESWSSPSVYQNISNSTIGIPIQAEVFITKYKYYGAGIIFFADVNHIHSFWGITLCFQFGKLR